MKKTLDILGHDVVWHCEGVEELAGADIEAIDSKIMDGFSSGEIEVIVNEGTPEEESKRCFWEIVNWRHIADQLYAAGTDEEILKAKKDYDELQERVWNT